MAKKRTKIKKMILNDFKISDVEFEYGKKTYITSITPSEIRVKGVGKYDRKNEVMWWYLQHCCGAQGFGYSSNDTCPACESKTGVTQSLFQSFTFADPYLPQLMKFINKECNRLEKILQKNDF